jgi:predicted metal-dependent HD superfamily phosphohydrolase
MRVTARRFSSLWARLNLHHECDDTFARLVTAYSEPQRAYHTTQHLEECLMHFDQAAREFENAAEGELAIWFHDAVYDPRSSDNEEQSVQWASEVLGAGGVSEETIRRVRSLILITTHTVAPRTIEEALVADIDLAILGADRARFAEYEAQVRSEYAFVPERVFRQERARMLERFRQRPSIYWTDYFRHRLETQARRNLDEGEAR